jgi:hypothetical protein
MPFDEESEREREVPFDFGLKLQLCSKSVLSSYDRVHGVAGNPECWSDVFDHARCCQQRHGLYILPSVSEASDAQLRSGISGNPGS